MTTLFRYLGPLGFASTGLLLVTAYAKGEPPSLVATMMGLLACTMAAVAVWQDW